ncbi:MAG TPA: GntR family transcriptional regulator [Vicinamibacterales bacterium]|nr:GntR family transcriptional regulator [Vicinamibacterales bacterium]
MAQATSDAPRRPVRGRTSLPAYRRICADIRSRIEGGDLSPGDRVESERQLARRFEVSLMTARAALKELEAEGLVERRLGSGTYVAPPRIHFNRLQSFSEQMAVRGERARSRILSVQVVADEIEVAVRLGLPPGSRLVRLERVRFGGAEPFAFETTYLSERDFPGLSRSLRANDSLFEVLRRDHGVEPSYAEEEVDALSADARIAHLMSIPRGSALLRIRQVLFDAGGRRLLYDVGIYRSERHSLLIRRFR